MQKKSRLRKPIRLVSFYSYKGGVGRSLALGHVGVALAEQGHKVLLVDMDLEAPGLHAIHPFRNVVAPAEKGLLELLQYYMRQFNTENLPDAVPSMMEPWLLEEYATPVWAPTSEKENTGSSAGSVWLMAASGCVWQKTDTNFKNTDHKSDSYSERLMDFNWNKFYEDANDVAWDYWLSRITSYGFDYVLLDSRTGLSDPFYISLTLAADAVLVCGFNQQNVAGIRDVWRSIQSPHFRDVYGVKRLHLLGSPEPELDPERWARWEAAVREPSVWPEFPGFLVKLPYYKEFAMDERLALTSDPSDQAPSGNRIAYQKAIETIAKALQKSSVESIAPSPEVTPEPTNPFALLRADYATVEELSQHFVDPGQALVRAMQAFKPVVMQGARGCGKTMLGRYFSYERELIACRERGMDPSPQTAPEYLGLYLRIDIDLLNIFCPPTEGERAVYDSLFGQFFDLLVFRKALAALDAFGGVLNWVESEAEQVRLYTVLLREFGDLGKTINATQQGLLELVEQMLSNMRLYVKNPRKVQEPFRLQSNILLKLLVERLTMQKNSVFERCNFSVIVDEYEHYSESQQKVVNSRIKQIKQSDHTTYRIFVKHGKAGLHTTATLSNQQQIQPIHDFNLINLDEDIEAEEFARQQHRIAAHHLSGNAYFKSLGVTSLDTLLAKVTDAEQARHIAPNDEKLRGYVKKTFTVFEKEILAWFAQESDVLVKAVAVVIMNQGRLRNNRSKAPLVVIKAFQARSNQAQDWLHNYSRGTLSWLANLYAVPSKLAYAGSDMVITLAGRNVRTFLEFCRAIVEEWFASRNQDTPALPLISVDIQTKAMRSAAENYRNVLRSLPYHSKELLSLADRLGRLFAVLAKNEYQSEPEINHFSLEGDLSKSDWYALFETAYAESVLLRLKGNKQKSDTYLEQDDWQLNPCFAPNFGFSPRRKKKLAALNGQDMEVLLNGTDDDYKKWQSAYVTRWERQPIQAAQQGMFDRAE